MKKLGIGAAALIMVVAFAGCDLFRDSLDVVEVDELPSYSSKPANTKDDAYAAIMNSGMAMTAAQEIVENAEGQISDELAKQNSRYAASLFTPTFGFTRDDQITFDDDLTIDDGQDKGSNDGDFELIIEDETDANNAARVDGEASGTISGNYDNTVNPQTVSQSINGSANFLLEILKDQKNTEFGELTVKAGSRAHFIADGSGSMDGKTYSDEQVTGTVKYDTDVQFGYTMTLDGVDNQAGKYILIVDVRESQNFSFDSSNPDTAVSEVESQIESFGTLKVYNNSNQEILNVELTPSEVEDLFFQQL